MNYRFDTLTTISFKHKYFSNERFEGLQVKIPEESAYRMTGIGLLFKSYKDGFKILFNTGIAGKKRERNDILSEDNMTFRFHILLNAPSFYNYTADISGDLTNSIFYFTNAPREPEGVSPKQGTLHIDDTVSKKDLYPLEKFRGQFFSKPFGLLDLHLNPGLEDTYTISFHTKATFWRYFLISEHLKELQNPAVINPDGREVFDGPAEYTLPDGKKALAFISKSRINLSESGHTPVQLVENYGSQNEKYKIIIGSLPLPDIHTISCIDGGDDHILQSEISDIFIY